MRFIVLLLDALGGGDAVEHGHLQVQQHDVHRRMRQRLQQFFAVRALQHHLRIGHVL